MTAHDRHLGKRIEPRGLRRDDAAAYVGVSASKFDDWVASGKISKPLKIEDQLLWDRFLLDDYLHSEGTVGFVYFIQSSISHHIKIGFSTFPDGRLKNLETGHPGPLTLLGTIPCRQSEEGRLHTRFALHRCFREWFNPAPELLAFIAEIAASQ